MTYFMMASFAANNIHLFGIDRVANWATYLMRRDQKISLTVLITEHM